MTQPDVVAQWQQSLAERGLSPSTLQGYTRAVAHFARWFERSSGEPFAPDRVISRDVRDWVAYQQTVEKARPRTVGFRLTALRQFFRWCRQAGLAREDPTAGIHAPRPPRNAPHALSRQEERRLLRAVHRSGSPRDIAIVEVLLGMALRVGDVEMGRRFGKIVVRRGKHGQSREIPLVGEARRALAAYLEVHPQRDHPDAPLWWGQRGPLRSRTTIWDILQKYAYQARIDGFGPHTLRHTFATRYLEANPGDMRGLAALLGHARLDTVMIYTEPSFEDLGKRMARMGRSPGSEEDT